MAGTNQDNAAAYGKVVAKAWRDPAFKARLLADPQAVLKEAGVAVPAGVTVKVVENSASLFHLVLPSKPAGEIPDEALNNVAGGVDILTDRELKETILDIKGTRQAFEGR